MRTRRHVLQGAASLVALVAASPALAFDRDTPAALRPWVAPGALVADPRLAALEWAVLVPNPHNRQPWLVQLEGDAAVTLACDLERRLPQTDPFDRQITIGLGCFVEMFVLAAGAAGYGVEVVPFPDGAPAESARLDARPVARLTLIPGQGTLDPLFAQAPFRRTNKAPYDDRRPAAEHLAAVLAAPRKTGVAVTTAPDEVAAITGIALRAGEVEFATPRTLRESIDLMRIGQSEIDASPDGIDLSGPVIEDLYARGILTREAMMDQGSPAYRQGAALYAEPLANTSAWIHQTTDGNTRADQIAAGRDWLRINLAATAVGLDVHPYSQAAQEYPEVAPMAAELDALLGVAAPRRLQMLARIGYGPDGPPSPRWPAAAALR